jgi:hypothetical protein
VTAEKALVNLPSPLTASDELRFSRYSTYEVIKLTAGVHRQTWVSGTAMFIDVHVSNSSQKSVKKLELQLEKVTTFYDHAAAATTDEQATHLRLPDRTEKEVVARRIIKKERHGWWGTSPQFEDVATYHVDVPIGLTTVDTGTSFLTR